jgi:hypothetical protein
MIAVWGVCALPKYITKIMANSDCKEDFVLETSYPLVISPVIFKNIAGIFMFSYSS